MVEVYPNLWVGNQESYELRVKNHPGWVTVHACKEPYHRKVLGYSGRSAPNTHPEYLVAIRGSELALNMIDADNPKYIPKALVDAALKYIDENLNKGLKVFLHCNQGMSRSPGIALLFLAQKGLFLDLSYDNAKEEFRKVYPNFLPAGGVDGYCRLHWNDYQAKGRDDEKSQIRSISESQI